jgi:hypothetical protein
VIPQPSDTALIVLASLVIHTEESLGPGAHQFDTAAMQAAVQHPEVQDWLGKIDPVLLPQKRTVTDHAAGSQ